MTLNWVVLSLFALPFLLLIASTITEALSERRRRKKQLQRMPDCYFDLSKDNIDAYFAPQKWSCLLELEEVDADEI